MSFRQKALVSAVGLLFGVGILLLFPWWLGVLALFVMGPFFLKVLAA